MTFGGVKFLLPLNGEGDSFLTPPCFFRVHTMARNFNGGSYSQAGFSCVYQCVHQRVRSCLCDLHSFPFLPPKRCSSLLMNVEQAACRFFVELRGHSSYLLAQPTVSEPTCAHI